MASKRPLFWCALLVLCVGNSFVRAEDQKSPEAEPIPEEQPKEEEIKPRSTALAERFFPEYIAVENASCLPPPPPPPLVSSSDSKPSHASWPPKRLRCFVFPAGIVPGIYVSRQHDHPKVLASRRYCTVPGSGRGRYSRDSTPVEVIQFWIPPAGRCITWEMGGSQFSP